MGLSFCVRCDRIVGFEVCYREVQITRMNRKCPSAAKSIIYMEAYAVCEFCGEELYDPDVNDRNVAVCDFYWDELEKENNNDPDNL